MVEADLTHLYVMFIETHGSPFAGEFWSLLLFLALVRQTVDWPHQETLKGNGYKGKTTRRCTARQARLGRYRGTEQEYGEKQ